MDGVSENNGLKKVNKGVDAFSIIAGVLLVLKALATLLPLTYAAYTFLASVEVLHDFNSNLYVASVLIPEIQAVAFSLISFLLTLFAAILVFCNRKNALIGTVTALIPVGMVLDALCTLAVFAFERFYFQSQEPIMYDAVRSLSFLGGAFVWGILAVMLLLQVVFGKKRKMIWMRFVCFFPAVLWIVNVILYVGLMFYAKGLPLDYVWELRTTPIGIIVKALYDRPAFLPILFFGIWIVSSPRKTKEEKIEEMEVAAFAEAP